MSRARPVLFPLPIHVAHGFFQKPREVDLSNRFEEGMNREDI